MILIKYSKLKGAEFIPHLDTLRHLIKTVRRMQIPINYSNGFNPHMLLYMSSPIALGLKSESEFCLFDTPASPEGFKELFNLNSPKGINCEEVFYTEKKLNIACDITSAIYEINGVNEFNTQEVLSNENFCVFDKRANEERVVRDRIVDLYYKNGKLYAELLFGNVTLRPDYLIEKLIKTYGGSHPYAVKKDVKFLSGITASEYVNAKNAE